MGLIDYRAAIWSLKTVKNLGFIFTAHIIRNLELQSHPILAQLPSRFTIAPRSPKTRATCQLSDNSCQTIDRSALI